MTAYNKLFTYAVWTLLFAVIAVFWFSVINLSFNFPFYDDFENIVQFILRFRESSGMWDKLLLLFEQNFEHRVLFSKLVTLLQYALTGQVNIRWLIVLGNVSLLGIAALFYTFYREQKLSLPALFAICCLLFQVQHYEDTISWATCSLQHAPCICFSLWSFHLALKRERPYASAALALLALFSSANGLAAILIWLFITWLVFPQRKSALYPTILLTVVTAVHLATLTIHSGSLLHNAFSSVLPKFLLLLSFSGQLADPRLFGRSYSVLLGAWTILPLLIVVMQALRRKQHTISHLQWLCAAGIGALLFVAFLIVFARGEEPDHIGYQMDRYKIYAALFGVLAVGFYDAYADHLKAGVWLRHAVAAAAVVFCGSTYYHYYADIRYYRNAIEANQYNFLWSKRIYYPMIYQDSLSREYLREAQQSVLRSTTPSPDAPLLHTDWKNVTASLNVAQSNGTDIVDLRNDTFTEQGGYDQLFVAALEMGNPQYLFKVENDYPHAARRFLTTFERPTAPGFRCTIFKDKMKPGSYDLCLVSIKKGRKARVYYLSKTSV
nr:hypothetical protein [uncultured Dyadobacter sp.]